MTDGVSTERSTIRPRFFAALLRATERGPEMAVHLRSVADSLNCDPSTLTRYLREAEVAGWIAVDRGQYRIPKVTLLDRPGLEAAAGVSEIVPGGA